jgi:surface carbohydrate biosynthesis protein
MYNFFSNLVYKKFTFKLLKKKENLIIGMAHSNTITKLIKKNKTEIICLNNFINVYLVIILFFKKKKFNQINYYSEAIRIVNPKIIITSIDTNISFYKLKNNFPEKKFLSIQNGVRVNNTIKKENNLNADVNFCHGYKDINYYKSRINSKIIPLGSIKNNSIPNYKSKKINCLSYISQFREKNENQIMKNLFDNSNDNVIWKDYIHSEKKLIILLNKFCIKNKITLYIVGVSSNPVIEKKWYQNLLKKNKLNFVIRKNSNTSYHFLQKSRFIVCMHSTLGYEFLARSKKIIFFSRTIKNARVLNHEIKFGWPYIKSYRGFFYSNMINESELTRMMKNISNCSQKQWLKKISIIKKQIMIYNPNNSILKKKILELNNF